MTKFGPFSTNLQPWHFSSRKTSALPFSPSARGVPAAASRSFAHFPSSPSSDETCLTLCIFCWVWVCVPLLSHSCSTHGLEIVRVGVQAEQTLASIYDVPFWLWLLIPINALKIRLRFSIKKQDKRNKASDRRLSSAPPLQQGKPYSCVSSESISLLVLAKWTVFYSLQRY